MAQYLPYPGQGLPQLEHILQRLRPRLSLSRHVACIRKYLYLPTCHCQIKGWIAKLTWNLFFQNRTDEGSSTTTFCTCNGGWGAVLSTKTNAAKSTFLICAVDPPMTITTIQPTKTTSTTASKTTTTSTGSEPTETGFTIWKFSCSNDVDLDWYYNVVVPHGKFVCNDYVHIRGSYLENFIESRAEASFCGQTSEFYTLRDKSLWVYSDSGSIYKCQPWDNGGYAQACMNVPGHCMATPVWACITKFVFENDRRGMVNLKISLFLVKDEIAFDRHPRR